MTVLPEVLTHHMLTPLYPYITVSFVGSSDISKIAYYNGLIQSCYFFPSTVCNTIWGHFSDRFSRKSALLLGLIGYGIGTLLLGLSFSLNQVMAALVFMGCFAGNTSVAKGFVGEIVQSYDQKTTTQDQSKIKLNKSRLLSRAYSLYGVVFGVSGIIGSIMGGILTGSSSGSQRPYLSACVFGTSLAFLGVLLAALFLPPDHAEYSPIPITLDDDSTPKQTPQFFLIRIIRILTRWKTLAPLLMYSTYALASSMFSSAIPLLASSSTSSGGYGLEAISTASIITLANASKLLTKALFWKLHDSVNSDTRLCYRLGIFLALPAYLLAPQKFHQGNQITLTPLYLAALFSGASEGLTYLSIVTFLTEQFSTDNDKVLGLAHGLAGTAAAFSKTLGPTLTGALWIKESDALNSTSFTPTLYVCLATTVIAGLGFLISRK